MFQFPKKQKLCSEKSIDKLFSNGKSILEDPFLAIWDLEEKNNFLPLRALIVVSKKKIKKANHRNTLKRRVREAYRIQKKELELLLERNKQQLNLAIIYRREEMYDYKYLEKKINLLLKRLIKVL